MNWVQINIQVNDDFRYMKIHIFALRWRDDINRSSQLRTLLKLVVVNTSFFYVLKFSNELLFFFFDLCSNKTNWAFNKVLYPVMFNGLP